MADAVAGVTVRVAESEEEVRACWPPLARLRPNLASANELVESWRAQTAEGYRVAYANDGALVGAAMGFRLLTTLAWGRILYVDDLAVTESSEGRGLAVALLNFIKDEAVLLGCAAVHLDSGYQRHRAHALYLRNGFALAAHHFAWPVDRPVSG